ncbi:hypothetical protein COHA_010796 [Chlorella ohadii]|uniref:Uncharacterized protein n=1 Tax=Chlorella ohadii TaxID=2649997 RepID=A0AAD5DD55_9CHLO|nr:hypothetical protein COHA_010796 [Chlorella ohadii]
MGMWCSTVARPSSVVLPRAGTSEPHAPQPPPPLPPALSDIDDSTEGNARMRLAGLLMLAFAIMMHFLGSPQAPFLYLFAWMAGVLGPSRAGTSEPHAPQPPPPLPPAPSDIADSSEGNARMRLAGLLMLAFATMMHFLGSPQAPFLYLFAWIVGVLGPSQD